MGVVYESFDSERRSNVALKVMRSVEAAALYRFKKEFRVLADLHHRNVVTLHELVATTNRWFLTMELLDGVSFRAYSTKRGCVRRFASSARASRSSTARAACIATSSPRTCWSRPTCISMRRSRARDELAALGARNPERIADMVMPGISPR
ncbi:hypothetical protein BH11MYX3_BH11MYX3_05660 [soil metagenome]